MMRTAQDVLAVVKERGLAVRVDRGPPPVPILMQNGAPASAVTEALLNALKAYRLEIIAELERDYPAAAERPQEPVLAR